MKYMQRFSYLEGHTLKDYASFDVSGVKKLMLRNESMKNLTETILGKLE